MRKRWVYINGEAIPIGEHVPEAKVFIRGDLQPYQSMVTGEMVDGRSKHREHLRMHGVVEVGDAYDKGLPQSKPKSDPRLREHIARMVYTKL